MAGIEDLVNLGNLITSVRGQRQTQTQRGGTTRETTQTDVSDEGIQELIRGILEGPGGVQQVGGAARSAGVFDSTTEDLLLGNLYARAASQAELARSPTVRETETPDITTTTEIPGMGLGPLAGTLAATTLAAPLVGRASEALAGGGGIGGIVGSMFRGGGGAAAGGAGAAIPGGFMSQVATGGAQAAGSAIPGGFMSQVATGGVPGAAGGVAGGATSFLGGLQGQRLSPVDVGASIASGFAMGGPVGAGVAALGTVMGNMLGRVGGGTVICTALKERGLLDAQLYAKSTYYLDKMPQVTLAGYQYWAVSVADKIRAGSKFWTSICLPFAKQRTQFLVDGLALRSALRNPLGAATVYIGEPGCHVIGKVLSARERIYG
jgi:hypothetical protein